MQTGSQADVLVRVHDHDGGDLGELLFPLGWSVERGDTVVVDGELRRLDAIVELPAWSRYAAMVMVEPR